LGNLHTFRDYIYVDDTAACLAAMVQAEQLCGIEVFNVGTGREHDVRSVAECIARIKGLELALETDPLRARRVDRVSQRADIHRAMNKLHWSAQYDLEKALELVVSRTKP
jgi:UDP-glucose 4-epimerase